MNHRSHALFLDRDGTINLDNGYLSDPDQIELLPGVATSLYEARSAGFHLFLFTNQSGIGRGYYTLNDVARCNQRLLELLGLGSDLFTRICVAPEHPEAPSHYRKPSPRFIAEMCSEFQLEPSNCWMIGDRRSDWQAGRSAGIHAAAVRTGEPWTEDDLEWLHANGVPIFADLPSVIASVLTNPASTQTAASQ